jgi:hypothetical protein
MGERRYSYRERASGTKWMKKVKGRFVHVLYLTEHHAMKAYWRTGV